MFIPYIDTLSTPLTYTKNMLKSHTTVISTSGTNFFLQNNFERELDESVTISKWKSKSEFINI